MKKLKYLLVLCMSLIACTVFANAAYEEVDVYLDDQAMFLETPALMINNSTYVPLRTFCETASDCSVTWNQQTLSATISSAGMNLQVTQDGNYLVANGRYLFLPNRARVINGVMFVPVRTLAQVYGMALTWNSAHNAVFLESGAYTFESGESYYDDEDVYWLSRIIYAESGNEPFEGKLAVGNVIMNRVENSQFPDTVKEVIFDRRNGVQFTPTVNNAIYKTPSEECIIAAKICLEGYEILPNGLYFLNPRIAKNQWASRNRPYVTTIGNHAFYA